MHCARRVFVAVVLTAATFTTAVTSSASAAPAGAAPAPAFGLAPGRPALTYAGGPGAPTPASASATATPDATVAPAPTTSNAAAGPVTAQFVVTYHNFSAPAQAAFQAAVDVWSHLISSAVPIRVDATWKALGSNILGSAGPYEYAHDFPGAAIGSTFYPIALANARAGTDLDTAHVDISSSFNSAFSNWYLGTDGNPSASQYDLETIVLHELAHGLGFIGSMDVNGGTGTYGINGLPFVFDQFAVNGANQSLLGFGNGTSALAAQLQSGSVFFHGANADAADGGPDPELYAPNPWEGGSSFSHLDESVFPPSNPNALMTPIFVMHEVHHAPGPIVLGAFADMGWTDVNGIAGSPYLTPLAFGTLPSPGGADGELVLTNLGGTSLTITSGSGPALPFTATLPAGGTIVAGGQSIGIPVHFDATTPSAFPYSSSVTIVTDAGTVNAPITGGARSRTDTQSFVYAAYVDFLGRAPNGSELSYWAGQLDSGQVSRGSFVNLLSTSAEWVHAIVTQLYWNTLGRGPDSSGLNYWTGIIQNGTLTVAQVAAQFYASDEYFNGFGGGTNRSWVHDLYVKIVHREPDPSGWDYWTAVTAQQGRFTVAYAFYQSSESAHDRVADLYGKLLGRAPEASGWDYWSQVVLTYGDIALATNLASSAEYAQRAVVRFP